MRRTICPHLRPSAGSCAEPRPAWSARIRAPGIPGRRLPEPIVDRRGRSHDVPTHARLRRNRTRSACCARAVGCDGRRAFRVLPRAYCGRTPSTGHANRANALQLAAARSAAHHEAVLRRPGPTRRPRSARRSENVRGRIPRVEFYKREVGGPDARAVARMVKRNRSAGHLIDCSGYAISQAPHARVIHEGDERRRRLGGCPGSWTQAAMAQVSRWERPSCA